MIVNDPRLAKDPRLIIPLIKTMDLSYFRIPPIIGEVNYKLNKFVIIYATMNQCVVEIKLHNQKITKHIDSAGGKITRIVINLDKNIKYETIIYYINEHEVFSNRLNMMKRETLVFVSCDYPELDTGNSLWNLIMNHIPDVCFHIGDNIYGDAAFMTGVNIITKHRKQQIKRMKEKRYIVEDPIDECCIRYRETYEKTWKRWAARLPNTSHITIWDDHDVVEGYNTMIHNNDETDEIRKLMYGVGKSMYKEYQESTRLDHSNTNNPIFKHRINHNMVVLIIDRINKVEHAHMKILLTNTLDDIKQGTVIVAFTSAPIPIINGIKSSVYKKTFGIDGLWDNNDLMSLYDVLFNWMGNDRCKNVVLIGGDIHIGISGVITSSLRVIPFFITSPLSTHPSMVESCLASSYNNIKNPIVMGGYNITIDQAKAKRNFLVCEIDDNGRFKGELIYSRATYPKKMISLPVEAMKMKGYINK